MTTYLRLLLALAMATLLATALTHAQARIEPIRAQTVSIPMFDRIDIARGSFRVAGVDDVFARHLGIADALIQTAQITERLQVLPLSGGERTRARFVCVTFEGVLFTTDEPCDLATPPPPIDVTR